MATPTRSPFLSGCLSSCCIWRRNRTLSYAEVNRAKWRDFGNQSGSDGLPPIFVLLIDLYDGKDVVDGLESCRINPDYTPDHFLRNDLEYYVPQLTNFVAFHEDFLCQKLTAFLEEVCKADPYFAHSYYWYMNSLLNALEQQKVQETLSYIVKECSTESRTQLFLPYYEKFHQGLKKKLKIDEYEKKMKEIEQRREQAKQVIQSYKADDLNLKMPDYTIKAVDIELKPYQTCYMAEENVFPPNPFTSTILFLEDLYSIAEGLTKAQDKLDYLKMQLHAVNKSLPSCVYIPFIKDSLRSYSILNIVIEESKVFSTKERSPFYLCMEIFRPQEELAYEYNDLFHIEEVKPEGTQKKKKKKRDQLLGWAKKTLGISQKPKPPKIEVSKKSQSIKEPDEQFRISKLTENESSPITLKRVTRSHEGKHPFEEKQIKRLATQSLVVSSHKESLTDLLLQPVEEEEEKKIEKAEYTIPHQSGRVRKYTSDVVVGEAEIGSGLAAVYQEDENYNSSILSSEGTSKEGSIINTHEPLKHSQFKKIESVNKDPLESNLTESLLVKHNESEEEEKHNGEINSDSSDRDRKSIIDHSHIEPFDLFGEGESEEAQRIKRDSPFRHLRSWKLIHLIVKSGADMKEEQFAIQLISQFDQIFKNEKTKLLLTPYEIVSLGSDFGIVEMVKDILTMSRLKEKMYRHNIFSLNDFFIKYYGENVDAARKKFCRSLAAYSLVCYFLQIKDRHNGNILFHKEGYILHIDFGFLLSNSPGKGINFEKIHFKLLNEYVEVLGGPRSSMFQTFRKLFYRGFMAARKHKEQILILVRMMYSTQGASLPCFKAGKKAIEELEQRFDPPGVHEKDLPGYCYNLINQSLDNWRAKCYDKYQYHFQGIFY